MHKLSIPFIVVLYIALSPANVIAQEYRWVDEKGVLHFSDNPPPENIKTKSPLTKDVEPPVAAPKQKTVPRKTQKKKTEKEPQVKEPPAKSEAPLKLYDIRGKVVKIMGLEVIVLDTGEKIKYIGVRDPSTFLAKNGLSHRMEEAVRFHEKLVKGKTVTVLLGKRKRDNEGNYLGHVFLGQQAFVNAELLRNGFAMTEEYPSDFEYQALFNRLQRDAQEKGEGIWSY